MKLLDRLSARLELYRLEQKYARRKNRTTFSSGGAQYVDGEYIYPNGTGLSSSTTSSNNSSAASSPVDHLPMRNNLGMHGRGVMSAGLGLNNSHRNSRIWAGGAR